MPSSSLFCPEDGSTKFTHQNVCCAIAQAIGNHLPLGPGFEPKSAHVGYVLDTVTGFLCLNILLLLSFH
jgi:hypothetical protein